MSAIEIRAVVAGDKLVWRDLWTQYLTFYDTTVSDEVYSTTWNRLFIDSPYEPSCLLAWDGERAVGLAHYFFHRHAWRVENVCYLQDLFAAPDARGKGVGRGLMEAVYAKADKAKCPDVYWTTQDFNTTARKLYDDIGTLTPFIKYQR
ncbi:MAG: GNAT family N-acetyltransferase [Pseudomonadota bacterium]